MVKEKNHSWNIGKQIKKGVACVISMKSSEAETLLSFRK